MADPAFFGAEGRAVAGMTTSFESCGFAFSSCFLATPSSSFMIVAAR
jgi:hypothetical protein